MTLRTRLLLTVGLLLAVALVASGGLVVGITRTSLIGQLDVELIRFTDADVEQPGPRVPNDPTGRRFAVLVYDRQGELIDSRASGPSYAPDPLPSMPAAGEPTLPLQRIVERSSVDGSLSYRMLALPGQGPAQGLVIVLGAPMSGVERSVSVMVSALAVVGLIVLAVMLIAGWFIIRRDLRPLEKMTATAESISAGDLTQRVAVEEDHSEVGRLGNAFNSMLDKIQASFESQQAALSAKERSESQLRQFVADASHELRTPLTAVRGYSELYRAGGLADDADLDQAMARIGSESRRMAALVEDLLLLARLDQGRPLRHDPVALSDVVGDALNDLQALEPARPVQATVEPDVVVTGDEDRLRQVIGNLMTNVRVHTPADTPVDVNLTTADGNAVLTISDHGPGIDPAHVEHIFDRFYRADPGRSRDRGGSGLGLSIASSVVAAHVGTIAYSATPGGGATFTVTLPRG